MKEIFRIAIDGPSGAGKSTIARLIAAELDIDYIDTGAMYRAVGYKMKLQGIAADQKQMLQSMLENTDIDFVNGDIILDGEVVNDKIRTSEISRMASVCSALPAVREKLVDIQRKMGTRKSVIMDGRDIGTNVLRDAEYKFFLTASAEERAERRYRELLDKGESITREKVLRDIIQRDHNDMTRELNPLTKAEDAVEIDTTGLTIQQVTDRILSYIE
ncbi:MAG: (d)CMP kinase [Firmicutes bacterium]|nr:(d)CMP kinase [Bacillota bacterium]